jgi:hypothetical protein
MGKGRLSYADRAKFRFTLNQNTARIPQTLCGSHLPWGFISNSHFGNFARSGLRRSGVDLGDERLSRVWESNGYDPTWLEAIQHKSHYVVPSVKA